MIGLTRQIAIFSKVVKHGSFKLAAAELQLSPSVVSHHISDLEKKLGIALLYRTTRQLSLTADGQKLLPIANTMQAAADEFIATALNQGQQLSGEVNITLPAVLAQSSLIKQIGQFSLAHQAVNIKLDFSDARRDIIRDNYDLAIRMGSLNDSSLICRKLDDVPRRVVVAPSYLKSKPAPKQPQDLKDWDFIALSPVASSSLFKNSFGEPFAFKAITRLSVNNAHALLELTRSGAGFAILPAFLVDAGIQKKSLTAVLTEWPVQSIGIYAVWPANTVKNNLVARLMDFLTA